MFSMLCWLITVWPVPVLRHPTCTPVLHSENQTSGRQRGLFTHIQIQSFQLDGQISTQAINCVANVIVLLQS